MKLTVKVKLLPTPEQYQSLKKTMEIFNDACNHISKVAFREKKFSQVPLHHLTYFDVRKRFSLSAQFVVRAIDKVSQSYKIEKKTLHKFKKHSAVVYDQRLLSFKNLEIASMLSISGRLKVSFVFGKYAFLDKNRMKGQADLTLENGKLFLNVVIEMPDEVPFDPKGALGVDFGIINLATTSDGDTFSGKQVDTVRKRTTQFKKRLQKRNSKNSRRHLRKLSGKETRFKKHTNHVISKQIVSQAKGTYRAIALEDLKDFNGRQTVRKADRERFGKWAFDQLRQFIEYKSKLAGVPVIAVDARNTSRTCSVCGFVSKSNRKSQSIFSCCNCGFTANADFNASINIASRAAVSPPIAVHLLTPISSCSATASPVNRRHIKIYSPERPAVSAAG